METKSKYLLILGNGFDLDLGLASSYSAFIKSPFFNNLKSNNIQVTKILDEIKSNSSLNQWVDLEKILKQYAVYYGKNNQPKSPIECRQLLEEGLHKYISECKPNSMYAKSNAYKVLEGVVNNGYFEVITFNYTNPFHLTKIQPFETPLKHIHGSCDDNSIILGFDDDKTVHEKYTQLVKTCSPKYVSNQLSYKIEEAEMIIIFGHSLGETDYFYFSELFKKISSTNLTKEESKEIHIFTADDKSKIDILTQLRVMNNYRTGELMTKNTIEFYRTKNNKDSDKLEQLLQRLDDLSYSREVANNEAALAALSNSFGV